MLWHFFVHSALGIELLKTLVCGYSVVLLVSNQSHLFLSRSVSKNPSVISSLTSTHMQSSQRMLSEYLRL